MAAVSCGTSHATTKECYQYITSMDIHHLLRESAQEQSTRWKLWIIFPSKDQNLCNLMLFRSSNKKNYKKKNSALPQTGTTSATTRWKSPQFKQLIATPSIIRLPGALPLLHLNWKLGPVMYEINIKNCKSMVLHADTFQASFPLPAKLVFSFLCKVASLITF